MKINFGPVPKQERWNEYRMLLKRYGQRRATLIGRRLADIQAADNLRAMKSLPGRCHELTGDRAGQLALDLEHPYRLIFEITEPIPKKSDGGLDWEKVTEVTIIEVVDYHG